MADIDKPLPARLAEWIALLLEDNPDPVTLGVMHATADGARVGVQTTEGDCVVTVAQPVKWELYGDSTGRGVAVLPKGEGGCVKPEGFVPDLYESGFQHMRRAAAAKGDELLACPFCGYPASVCPTFQYSHTVRCRGCDSAIPAYETVDKAIAAWNRRA